MALSMALNKILDEDKPKYISRYMERTPCCKAKGRQNVGIEPKRRQFSHLTRCQCKINIPHKGLDMNCMDSHRGRCVDTYGYKSRKVDHKSFCSSDEPLLRLHCDICCKFQCIDDYKDGRKSKAGGSGSLWSQRQ